MNRRRVVSITPALAGQDLGMIIAELFSIEALLRSNRKSDRRAAAVALVSVVEQYCRLVNAEMLGLGRGTMPDRVEIRLADIDSASHLSKALLVSLTLNFQSVEAVERMLKEYGMGGVLERKGLRAALAALFAARHDLVHTAAPVWFNVRAAYRAVVELVFGIAEFVPELEADMRLAEGDFFKKIGMHGRSRAGYERAEPLCRALAKRNPGSAPAHARLGLALSGLDRHEEALASYDKAAEMDPGRAVTHLDRALPLAKLERYEEALASCESAIGIDSMMADAHLVRANILAGMGRNEDALADCNRAAEIDGSLARAHLVRGDILASMGRSRDALDAYERSIELDRYDENVRVRRADLLAATGRSDEALDAYDVAIDLGPMSAEVHLRKSGLLASLGRYDDALCCCSRALELDPDHPGALAGKGSMLALLGSADKADEYRRRAAYALKQSRP